MRVLLCSGAAAGAICLPACSDAILGEFHGRPDVVVVGDGGLVLSSYDGGRTFPLVRSDTDALERAVVLDDRAIAVGDAWLESVDGTQWRPTLDEHQPLTSIVANADRVLGVGAEGTIVLAMADEMGGTISFVTDDPNSGIPLEVAVVGGDRFLAIAETGESYWSSDGVEWSVGLITGFDVTSAAFGNDVFVIVGDDSGRLVSPDGVEVDAVQSRLDDPWIWDVTFGDGRFVAVGIDAAETGGLVYESEDGVAWDVRPIDVTLSSIAWTGDAFLGSDGTSLYRSEDARMWSEMASPDLPGAPIKSIAVATGSSAGFN